jgi:hypothetical protein
LVLALAAAWLAAVAAAPAPQATETPSPTPSHSQTPTPPTPVPTPTSHGTVNLSAAAGPAGSPVTLNGSGFKPGEPIAVYLDTPDHALGGLLADGSGSFSRDITIPQDASVGTHIICVSQQPQPRCAQFSVQAPAPSPTPAPTETPSPSPSPSPSTGAALTTPSGTGRSALRAFVGSPLGIVLILILLAALAGSIFWFVRSRRAPGKLLPPAARPGGSLGGPPGGYRTGQPQPPGAYRPGQPPPTGGYRPGQPQPPRPYPPGQPPPPGAYRPGQPPPPPGAYRPGQPPPPGTYRPGQPPPPPRRTPRPPDEADEHKPET